MSIFIVGDPHIKQDNKKETDQLLSDCIRLIKERNPDFIVCLGDVFDDGEYVYHGVMARVNEFILELSKLKPLYVLVGNHDRSNPKTFLGEEHVLIPWKNLPNVTIVDTCHTMVWRDKKICMVCYVPNNRFHEACDVCDIEIMDYDLFFSHQEYKGCQINQLTGSECDVWKKKYPLNIAGHIHNKETVAHNLIYVGTPMQQTFAEPTNKGVYLLNYAFQLEQLQLSIQKKIHYKINYEEITTVVFEKGAKIKVTITGPTEDVKKILKESEMVKKFKGAMIIYKDTSKVRKRKNVVSNMSFEKRLKQRLNSDDRLKKVFNKYIRDKI